jgi:hypothetical protein
LEGLSADLAFPRVKREKQLNSCASEAVVVSCENERCGKKIIHSYFPIFQIFDVFLFSIFSSHV